MDLYTHGKTPLEALVAVSDSPFLVMRLLQAEVTSGYPAGPYALPDIKNARDTAGIVFGVEGIAQVGKLAYSEVSAKTLLPSCRIVVHWPTVVQNAAQLMLTRPSLAFLLFGFREIIQRRSVAAFELLQRKYCHLIGDVNQRFRGTPLIADVESTSPFLHPFDEDVLCELLLEMSVDKVFIGALRKAAVANYSTATLRAENISMLRVPGFPLKYRKKCTILRPGKYFGKPENRAGLPRKITIDPGILNRDTFGPDKVATFLHELMYLMDYGMPRATTREGKVQYGDRVRDLGVASIIQPGNRKRYLFVEWERWLKYRYQKSTRDRYHAIYTPARKYRHTMYTQEAAQAIVSALEDKYRRAQRSLPSVQELGPLSELWSKELERGLVSVFSLPELWGYISKATGRLRERRAERTETSGIPLKYEAHISTAKGTYEFVVYQYKRNVLFKPPWKLPYKDIWRPRSGKNRLRPPKLRKGVVELPGGGREYVYTFAFLSRHPTYPLDYMLNEQLVPFSKLQRRAFKQMRLHDSAEVRTRNEEDTAIIKLYRPDMEEELLDELNSICAGRPKGYISDRACILRQRLIKDGEYNIKKLPHGRYNHKIGEEIEKAKEKVEDV